MKQQQWLRVSDVIDAINSTPSSMETHGNNHLQSLLCKGWSPSPLERYVAIPALCFISNLYHLHHLLQERGHIHGGNEEHGGGVNTDSHFQSWICVSVFTPFPHFFSVDVTCTFTLPLLSFVISVLYVKNRFHQSVGCVSTAKSRLSTELVVVAALFEIWLKSLGKNNNEWTKQQECLLRLLCFRGWSCSGVQHRGWYGRLNY